MNIRLEQIGKRFNRKWIIRHVDLELETGNSYAILGVNGSGKSTLMKMLSGYLLPTEGKRYINAVLQDQLAEDHQRISYVAPYVDVYREMTLKEAVDFHFSFKKQNDKDILTMLDALGLPMKRELRDFSSGMLQRVKLALAFCSNTEILLLDEPLMNLDEKGIQWYMDNVREQKAHRITVIASNENEAEFGICDERMTIKDKRVQKT